MPPIGHTIINDNGKVLNLKQSLVKMSYHNRVMIYGIIIQRVFKWNKQALYTTLSHDHSPEWWRYNNELICNKPPCSVLNGANTLHFVCGVSVV